MTTIRIARANASGMANYSGSSGELVYNYSTNNLHFFTNTANVYYTSAVPVVYYYQGSVAAYTGLGYTGAGPSYTPRRINVERMPFATDTTFADTGYNWNRGDGVDSSALVSHSSDTDAYVSGGYPAQYRDHVQKYSFANNADATDHGELSVVAGGVYMGGASQAQPHASQTHAYYAGGLNWLHSPTSLYSSGTSQPNNYKTTMIRKWPFAAGVTGNMVKTGDLTGGQNHSDPTTGSLQSLEHGYVVGGQGNPPSTPYFSYDQDRYPFASDENATDVGEYSGNILSEGARFSSETHGYYAGGVAGHPGRDTILKFAFSSSLSFTDTGELTGPVGRTAGTGSTTAGYTIAGKIGPGNNTARVDKIPFANDTAAVNIGNYVFPGYLVVAGMEE